jgi:ABC-type dipeptide/oligopeptide/nickel transport system permease subunit
MADVTVFREGGYRYVKALLGSFHGGRLDDVVMRRADIQQSFPYLALTIAVVAVLGPGFGKLIVAPTVTGWVLYARVMRAGALSLREQGFAASWRGTSSRTSCRR